jgi:hypothetical protein
MNRRHFIIVACLSLLAFSFSLSAQAQGFGFGYHTGYYHHTPPYGWNRGYWNHGYYRGQMGWWWVSGTGWYLYNAPVYPYPAYQPNTIIVERPVAPIAQPTPVPPPPPVVMTQKDTTSDGVHEMNSKPGSANYYYCQNPAGYYPTVPACPSGWAVTPANPMN